MVRVIDTNDAGALLTSPMNAHSLSRGDVIVLGTEESGYESVTVFNVQIVHDAPARRWVEFAQDDRVNRAGCGAKTGRLSGIEFGANEPVNRVVGGRSTVGGGLA